MQLQLVDQNGNVRNEEGNEEGNEDVIDGLRGDRPTEEEWIRVARDV